MKLNEQRTSTGTTRLLSVADAVLCLAALVALEVAAVAVVRHSHFSSVSEVLKAFTTLLPLGCFLGLVPAALGAAWWGGLRRAEDRAVRVALTLCNGALVAGVALWVSSGRRMQVGIRRPLFVLVLTLLAMVLTWLFARTVAQRWERHKGVRWLLALLVAIGIVEVVNQTVLPRLYPGFHAALAALVVLLAVGGTFAWAKVAGRLRLALGGILWWPHLNIMPTR